MSASHISKRVAVVWTAIRPAEWIKNTFVFAPMFFSGQGWSFSRLSLVAVAFVAFCAMSSAVYLFNDINDRELDRLHPRKAKRPIASGELSVGVAQIVMMSLVAGALIVVAHIPAVATLLFIYALINVAYSLWLKHIVIVDVFCIALGFVLRVFVGGWIINVVPSSWLILATFLLSLFLALLKRRHELLVASAAPHSHRPVLEHYSLKLVDELVSVVTPVTLITYILYTMDSVTIARFHTGHLYFTAVFVVFGIFRYLYLVHKMNVGGSPADIVWHDIPLVIALFGWVSTFGVIVYSQ